MWLKPLGVSLLLAGLFWAGFLQLSELAAGGLRPIVLSQYEKLSKDPERTYSRKEVQQHIVETAIAALKLNGWPGAPVLLVLAGSVLLCKASRRNNQS